MKKLLIIFTIVLSNSVIGQNWYQVPVPTTSKLLAIDFPSSSVGYIVGEDTTILKTTDGGQTWNQLPTNGIQLISLSDDINDVHFVDELTGFIVIGYSGTYKTVDGGQNWTVITGQTSSMCFPNTVYALAENNYFLGGAGCFEGAIIDEFNNGTWTRTTPTGLFWDSEERIQEFNFLNNSLGLAAVKNQYIMRTVDGGQSWDTIPTGIYPDGYLTSVIMVNDTLCYAGSAELNLNGFGLLKSVDAGLTWEEDFGSATFFYPDYFCFASSDNGNIYSGGKPNNFGGGIIFKTNVVSSGIWEYSTVDQPIYDMDSYGNDIAFGVGDSGYVVVNIPTIDLGFHEMDVNGNIVLYPNPASSKLTVESESPIQMMKVYNLAGREVNVNSTIVSDKCMLDVSELSAGIYSVLIHTENGVATKRFCIEQG